MISQQQTIKIIITRPMRVTVNGEQWFVVNDNGTDPIGINDHMNIDCGQAVMLTTPDDSPLRVRRRMFDPCEGCYLQCTPRLQCPMNEG